MSIDAISSTSNWWQSRNQTSAASNATTTSGNTSSGSITNTGSVAANNVSDFMAVFSADLQAMLGQLASDAASTATSSATTTTAATSTTSAATSTTDQTTASQQSGSTHHHHHHSDSDGGSGSVQNVADQLVNEIGQSQSGSLSADQINQSAGTFAADVMQALQSYGTTTPTTSSGSIFA